MEWEYYVHSINANAIFATGNFTAPEVTRMLNWYGSQGWEFVSNFAAAGGNGGTIAVAFIFKRPRQAGALPQQPHGGG